MSQSYIYHHVCSLPSVDMYVHVFTHKHTILTTANTHTFLYAILGRCSSERTSAALLMWFYGSSSPQQCLFSQLNTSTFSPFYSSLLFSYSVVSFVCFLYISKHSWHELVFYLSSLIPPCIGCVFPIFLSSLILFFSLAHLYCSCFLPSLVSPCVTFSFFLCIYARSREQYRRLADVIQHNMSNDKLIIYTSCVYYQQ